MMFAKLAVLYFFYFFFFGYFEFDIVLLKKLGYNDYLEFVLLVGWIKQRLEKQLGFLFGSESVTFVSVR